MCVRLGSVACALYWVPVMLGLIWFGLVWFSGDKVILGLYYVGLLRLVALRLV